MTKEKALSVIRWVAVTAGGALIGVLVTSIYQSARPSVSLIDIQPSVAANKQFLKSNTPVPVPASLQNAMDESYWTGSMRGTTLPYEDFQNGLDEAEHSLNDYFEGWNRLKANLPRLRALLERGKQATEDEKIEFYDLWERNDGFIYGSIRGDFERGTFALQHKQHTGNPSYQLFQESLRDGTRIWMVDKKGGLYPSYLQPHQSRDVPLNQEVAEDLAFFDSSALTSILDLCEKPEVSGERINKAALDEVFRARRQMSRWTVQVAISNKGDSPVAFLPQALLRIETSDLVVAGKRWGKPTEILLEHRDDSSELAPIYLEKGSARLVKYSSAAFIKDIEPGDSLLQAFDLGGFDCYVQISTAGGDLFTKTKYQTSIVKFASSNSVRP